ncbi:uncharacterized protein LOC130892065 [Diorhabda carinulata]|uniref:uncharacterized protein LOC130892065 n=1 Tax=Diorhabda carinulata TaxID=1163345 RepID=UPI0025A2B695|nr:uncharacterized protein LOC130892065 [Diorhabda carinulata]
MVKECSQDAAHLKECLCTKTQSKIQWSPLIAKRTDYSRKVLLGNWFEETCQYQKNKHVHTTEYLSNYGIKPKTTLPRSVIWDATIKNQGNDVLFGNYIDKSQESYMTSYYLSYQLLPEIAKRNPGKPPVKSQHIDELPKRNEQFLDYGNQENYGLGDYKKSTWKLEKNDPRFTVGSVNKETYIEPEKQLYKFRRWLPIRAVKGKYGDEYKSLPSDHPRIARCNPLTWECKPVFTQSV